MRKTLKAASIGLVLTTSPALAHHGHYYHRHHHSYHRHHAYAYSASARPHAWCGWYMRTLYGGGPEYNLARAWASRGEPSVAAVGVIVVWPHHVGVITGKTSSGWIVRSGNDGHRVRERVRSVANAIAFRRLT